MNYKGFFDNKLTIFELGKKTLKIRDPNFSKNYSLYSFTFSEINCFRGSHYPFLYFDEQLENEWKIRMMDSIVDTLTKERIEQSKNSISEFYIVTNSYTHLECLFKTKDCEKFEMDFNRQRVISQGGTPQF